jgi:hypothetical protein
MLRWSEVTANEVRNGSLRIEADNERLARAVVAGSSQRAHFYHSIAFRLGGWMTSVGQRIQRRYSEIVEPTLTPKIGSNRGAF